MRRTWIIIAAALVGIAALLLLRSGGVEQEAEEAPARAKAEPPRHRLTPGARTLPEAAPAAPPPVAAADEKASPPEVDPLEATWASIDMEEVRQALPDNLYWKRSVPTQDPAVEEERYAERQQWNTQYGKILAGEATEEEIRGYYDYRARIAGDSIEFATYLLDRYGEKLPERDVELLELARTLHRARLEEIPRKLEESLERKRQQDAARAAWLADEADFAGAKGEPE